MDYELLYLIIWGYYKENKRVKVRYFIISLDQLLLYIIRAVHSGPLENKY